MPKESVTEIPDQNITPFLLLFFSRKEKNLTQVTQRLDENSECIDRPLGGTEPRPAHFKFTDKKETRERLYACLNSFELLWLNFIKLNTDIEND